MYNNLTYNPNWMYQQPPTQDNCIVSAPSMDYVSNYPMAPGSSVLFKIENEPVIVEKSRGFSQMDSPTIAVYRLEKEPQKDEPAFITRKEFDDLKKYVDTIAKAVVPDE